MVKRGQQGSGIIPVRFAGGASTPALGFEALDLADVIARVGEAHFARPRRLAFFQIALCTQGSAQHEVDFVTSNLRAGMVAFTRPGQVERLSISARCEGRLLLFEPLFLSAIGNSAELRHIVPVMKSTPPIESAFDRIFVDFSKAVDHRLLERILLHEVGALLLRLQLQSQSEPANRPCTSAASALFELFEDLLESSFAEHRSTKTLARRLGCTEKTLNRACIAVTGLPPKTLIQQRVALEAKRVLAHSDQPVKQIAAQLGFSEPTNFVKFFRRTTGELPASFRVRLREAPLNRTPTNAQQPQNPNPPIPHPRDSA